MVVAALVLALVTPSIVSADAPAPATCSLAYTVARPGSDCVGKHLVQVNNGGYLAGQVKVELIGYDTAGNVLSVLPVASGYEVQLGSKLSPTNWKFKLNAVKKSAEMYAPLPILKVTAFDGTNRSEAYCSNIPYVDVLKPAATSVASADGGIQVLAMIPRVDDNNLQILIDGVNLFSVLQPAQSPTQCTPQTPCNGTADINGNVVEITNLIVDNAETIAQLATNTVSFTMSDLSCGGHAVVVQGQRAADVQISPLAAQCYKDDLADSAVATIFAVDITSPADGASGLTFPVTVQGEACHGRPITVLDINGLQTVVNPADLVVTQTNGINTYKLPFSKNLPKTDLEADFAGTNLTLGTLDLGSNRVTASATDDLGNRAYDSIFVGTGTTENPGIPATATVNALKNAAVEAQKIITQDFPATLDIDNAFVASISKAAVQKQFDDRCTAAETTFKAKIQERLGNKTFPSKTVNPGPCSRNCDVTPTINASSIGFSGSASCPVTFQDGKIAVTINMPNVTFTIDAVNSCGNCDILDDATKTVVDLHSDITVSNLKLNMEITENQILTGATPSVLGTLTSDIGHHDYGSVTTPCFISGVCDLAITIGTLGIVNLLAPIEFDVSDEIDFKQDIAATQPDPIKVQPIKMDESKVAAVDQTVSGTLSHVKITADGIVAGLKGTFATNSVDPEVQITPGALRTAPTPIPLVAFNTVKNQGGLDISALISDDTLNMFFASMALSGKLKTTCQDSGKTLGEVIPDICDNINLPAGELATVTAQGACHAIRGDSCESLTAGTGLLTAIKQGVCHGIAGDNCSTIPVSATALLAQTERTTCTNTPQIGLSPDMPLLFCSRQDVPPLPALQPGGQPNEVPVSLRLPQLSVALVLDRNKNTLLDANLEDLPSCFGEGAPTVGDCFAYALCLNVNLNFKMGFDTCDAGTPQAAPGFKSTFLSVQELDRQVGTVCGGSGVVGSDALMTGVAGAGNSVVTTNLGQKGQEFAPPICMKGLDLGGLVACGTPKLISVADGGDSFKDYLGITCAK